MTLSTVAFAQKAGMVTRFVAPASVEEAAPRPGLQPVSTAIKANNTVIKWKDSLVTGEGGRIRAQLNDGSILSVGSKSKLVVNKHDEKTQQSSFDLVTGQVRSQVVHLARPDSSFEVRTNTAVCGVLGTDSVTDGSSPVETLVIVITGVVAVKNSDPNVVGSTQLTAGQFTVVRAGQAPTGAQTANSNQVNNAVNGTTGSTAPQPQVTMSTLQVPSGGIFTLNGAASTGGIGNVVNYAWAIPARSFTQSSANPNLSVDTSGWPAATYTGTLTVTTDDNPAKIATAPFQFSVLAALPPNPVDTIAALAQAYNSLQPSNFASVFDPSYPGTSALAQQLEQAIPNIQAIQLTYPIPQTAVTGNVATCQVNFSFNITPKPVPPATVGTPFKYTTGSVNFTLNLNQATNKWLINSIVGQLGSPGMLSVPGTNSTTTGNTTSAQGQSGTTAGSLGLATFGVTSDPSLSVFEGGSVNGTFSVTPANGFLGSVAIAFGSPLPNGVTASTTGLVNITGTTAATTPFTLTAASNATPGQVLIPYTAVSGGITQTGNVTLNILPAGLTLLQNTVTVPVGGFSTNTTVTVAPTPASGYTGSVTFTTTPATVPGLTITPGPLNSNGTVVLKFTSTTATVGSAQFTLNATLAGATASQPMTVSLVAPFTAGAAPAVTLAALQPQSLSFPVTLNSAFTGSYTVTPPVVSGFTFAPVTSSNFTVATTAAPGNYSGNFTVTAGTYSAPVSATLIVNPPFDFTITGASLTLTQGSSTTANIVVSPVAGTGVPSPAPNVQLSINGVPAGFTATFAGPTTVSGSGAVTLNVGALANAPLGANSFNVSGLFGANGHTAVVGLNIPVTAPPFTITAGPSTVNVLDGGNGTATVTVQGLPGFSGAVAITSNSSVAQASGPASIMAGSSGTYTVTASGAGSLTFTGTVGAFAQTSSVAVAIIPGFTLSTSPASTFAGGSATMTVTVNRLSGFSGAVVVTPSPASGFSFSPPSATVAAGNTSAGFTVTVDPSVSSSSTNLSFSGVAQGGSIAVTTSGAISVNVPFTLTSSPVSGFIGQTVPISVGVTRGTGFTGSVTVSLSSSPNGVLVTPTSVVVPPGSSSASFSAVITATATAGSVAFSGTTGAGTPASVSVSLGVGAPFTLAPGSDLGTIITGTSKSTAVTVSFSQGFSGSVTLTAVPVGSFTAVLGSTSLTASGSPQLTITSPLNSTPGSGTIAVTATAGSYSLTANYTVNSNVPFTAQAGTATTLTVFHGFSSPISVAVAYNQPFAGSVQITATAPSGIQAIPQSTTLTSSGSVSFNLSASQTATSGQTVITVTGGGITVSIPFSVTSVDPFTVTVTPPVNLIYSIPGTLTATVTPNAGFTGAVLVTPSVSPGGAASFTPTSSSVQVPGVATGAQPASIRAHVNGSTSVTFSVSVNSGFVGSTILFSANGSSGGFTATPTGSANGTTTQPGFTISAPQSITVYSGNITQAVVTVTIPSGGNPVTVTGPTTLPTGIKSILPVGGSNTLSSSGTVTFQVLGDVTVSGGAVAGSGSIVFTGTSAGTSSLATMQFTAGAPFSIGVQPTALSIAQNGSGSFVVSTTANNGFAGSITITSQGTPNQGSLPTGINLPGNQGNATVSAGSSATFTYTAAANVNTGSANGSIKAQAGNFIASVSTSISTGQAFSTSQPVGVSLYSGFSGTVNVTITPGLSNGPYTVTAPTNGGQVFNVSPSSQSVPAGGGTATFTVTAGNQQGGASGSLNFSATDGVATLITSYSYSIKDPFTFSQTLPSPLYANSTGSYVVTVVPDANFSGTVTVTPSLSFSGSAGISAAQTLNVPTQTTATFTVTTSAATQSVTLGASGTTGGFTSSIGPSTVNVGSAYTLSLPSGTAYFYSAVTGSVFVTVNYSAGYTASVTVAAPLSLSGIASIQGCSLPGMRVMSNRRATGGPLASGAATQVATPANPTVCFSLTGSNPNVGNTNGTMTFNASDNPNGSSSNTASGSQTYTVADPYSISVSAPNSIPLSTPTAVTVTVTPHNGFTGSVNVSLSAVPAAGTTFSPTSMPVNVTGTTQVVFSLTLGSGINIGSSTTVNARGDFGNFSANANANNSTLASAPFTISFSAPSIYSGITTNVPVTVTFATGYVGTVTVTPQGFGAGIQSVTPATLSANAASPTVTFAVTGSASNVAGTATSGKFLVTDPAGNSLTSPTQNFTVIDPYTVFTSNVPGALSDSVAGSYTVNISPSPGFSGSVSITPKGTPSGVATFNPSSAFQVNVAANTTFSATVGVTLHSGFSGTVTIGADTSAQSFALSANAASATTSAVPFTITSVNPGTVYVYNALSSTVTVNVQFAAGYTGAVTVSYGGSSGASPQRGGRTPSATRRPGTTGGGISSVLPSGSATLTASGTVTFNVIGSGSGNGTLTFNASDGSNMATGTTSYVADVPVTYTIQASPLRLFNGVTTTVAVQITSNNNFTGSVDVIPAGNGAFASGTLPANVSYAAPGGVSAQIAANATQTFNINYTAAANATDATVSDNFYIEAGGGGYRVTIPMSVIVALPFTATFGTGSAGPMTVPFGGGTNQVTVQVAATTGYTGSIAINPPATPGISILPSSAACAGSCNQTFTLTGGSALQALTSANYSVATTPGNYSINLSSQYDVTYVVLGSSGPAAPYFLGDAGTVVLSLSGAGTLNFYGSAQVSVGSAVAPFTGLQVSGASQVNLAGGGVGNVSLSFASGGTPGDAGAGKILATQITVGVTGSPNLQLSNAVYSNFGSVTTVAPFTIGVTSLLGPSGGSDNRVFTGATAQGDNNGIPSMPNQTRFLVLPTFNSNYSPSNYLFTSSSASGTVSGCLGGFAGCTTIAAYGVGSPYWGTWWFVQTGPLEPSGSKSMTISYYTTGTGGGTYTATTVQNVMVTPPYTIGSPLNALGSPVANPIPVSQGSAVSLFFPVTFAAGYNTAAGSISALPGGMPAGLVFSTVTPATPTNNLAVSVSAAVDATIENTPAVFQFAGSTISGSTYTGISPALGYNVMGASFTVTAGEYPAFAGAIPQAITYTVSPANGFSASVMLVMAQQGTSNITFACASPNAGYCGSIPGNPISTILAPGGSVTVYYTALTGQTVTAGSDVLTVTACSGNAVYTGSSCTGTSVQTFTFPVSVTAPNPVVNPQAPFNLSALSYSSVLVTMNSLNGFADSVYTTLGDNSGLSNCKAPYNSQITPVPATISPGGSANIGVYNYLFSGVSLYVYGSYGSGGLVCIGSGGVVLHNYVQLTGVRTQGGKPRNGDLAITPQDITASPLRPRRGDTVQFLVKVENLGTLPVANVVVAMMAGGKELSRATIPSAAAGASTPVTFSWKAGSATEPQFSFVVDPDRKVNDPDRSNNTAVMKPLGLSTASAGNDSGNAPAAASRAGLAMTIRNDGCAGVRLVASSQSSCGGQNDIEIMPAITSNGRLSVRTTAPGGGMQDLGAMALSASPDVSQLAAATLQSQSDFQQGHVYLVKSGSRLAMVRVVKINSSINPKLAILLAGPGPGGRTSGQPGRGSANPGDVLGSIRGQQQSDQILDGARVMIDLEWVQIVTQ